MVRHETVRHIIQALRFDLTPEGMSGCHAFEEEPADARRCETVRPMGSLYHSLRHSTVILTTFYQKSRKIILILWFFKIMRFFINFNFLSWNKTEKIHKIHCFNIACRYF